LPPWLVALPEAKGRFATEYMLDPETAVLVFDELWRSAGEDAQQQYVACIKTLGWVLLELKEASKSGRRFLRSLPNEELAVLEAGGDLLRPYHKFHDLYTDRATDWLRRSAQMALRGLGKFGMVIDATIELVWAVSESAERWAMCGWGIAEALDRMNAAAETLEELLRDYTPAPPERGNGPRANSISALPDFDRQIVETLRAVGHRMVTMKLYHEMDRPNRVVSLPTLKKRLAALVRDGWLDNKQKARPKGYGLPEWRLGSPGA
jgi:hypothetical protein